MTYTIFDIVAFGIVDIAVAILLMLTLYACNFMHNIATLNTTAKRYEFMYASYGYGCLSIVLFVVLVCYNIAIYRATM